MRLSRWQTNSLKWSNFTDTMVGSTKVLNFLQTTVWLLFIFLFLISKHMDDWILNWNFHLLKNIWPFPYQLFTTKTVLFNSKGLNTKQHLKIKLIPIFVFICQGGNYSTAASSVRFTSTTPPAGSGGGGNGSGGSATNRLGGGQLPPVRSLTSPGSRQSPFPPELSPTTAASYQFRLQRTISAPPPQATTHLPGNKNYGAFVT